MPCASQEDAAAKGQIVHACKRNTAEPADRRRMRLPGVPHAQVIQILP